MTSQPITILQAIRLAVDHHQAGRLGQAENIYQQVLAVEPDNGDANHLLGVIAHQVGRDEIAIHLISKALATDPDQPIYLNSLGNVAKRQGKLGRAVVAYQKAVQIKPDYAEAHNNLGMVFQVQGDLANAVTVYQRAVQIKPDYVEAHYNLGVAYYGRGDAEGAVTSYERALNIKPDHERALNNLGVVLQSQGRTAQAIACYQKAVEANPDYAEAHYNLGVAYHEQGEEVRAIESYQTAITINPDAAEAHNNLGTAFQSQGKVADAIGCYQRALAIQPDYAEALNNQGNALKAQGNLTQAIWSYRKALEIKPDYAIVHNNLGALLQIQGNLEKAAGSYKKAVDVKPDYAEAYNNLANVLQAQGRFDQAVTTYQKALEIEPDFAEPLGNLANLYEKRNRPDRAQKFTDRALAIEPGHPSANRVAAALLRRKGHIKEALEILARVNIPLNNLEAAINIHFELGRLYDRDHQSDMAFRHFAEGNHLQANTPEACMVDRGKYLALVRDIRRAISPAWVDSWATGSDPPSKDPPVFLVGFPRSGTTLMNQILDSHPLVQVMEEKPIMDAIVKDIAALPLGFPDALASFTLPDVEKFQSDYFLRAEIYEKRGSGCILVDKYPLNIALVCLVFRLFPDAKIVLAIRHPYDVCLSNFMQQYRLNNAMANFFSLEDAAFLYDQIMGLWREYVHAFPLNFHEIKYEMLVDDFEGEIKLLLNFLSVDWDDEVLNYARHAENQKMIYTPSYQQVTEPIYQRAKYRWKRYIKQMDSVKEILAPHARAFGYRDR